MHDLTRRPRGDKKSPRISLAALLLAVLMTWTTTTLHAADPVPPDQAEFFETKVRPILLESCGKCHGPTKQASGLRLDSREALLEGGLNGPSVIPGNPDGSLLVQVIRQTHEDIKMPPKGKLPDPAVAAIAGWIKMGAPWPATAASKTSGSGSAANHWAFQPVKTGPSPTVSDPAWVRTSVDAYILARLDAAGLKPSAEADRRTLIRRLSFDLTGLPPSPEAVSEFVNDTRGDAYERLVDRLLASSAYGERWGRHWLDVARYADTKGYVFTEDRRYPYSYTYRDYVIRAFNEDRPYDRFITEQIAADKVATDADRGALAALGFITVGRRYLNNKEDILDDRIDVVTRGLLALTVTCARCHDHKFDPIPTDDYYSLFGVFNSSTEPADLPEIPAPIPAASHEDFRVKLAEAQKAVDTYLATKKTEAEADFRNRLGVYLRAAVDLNFSAVRRDPKVDERVRADKIPPGRFRAFSARWKARVDATRKTPDPIFAPWHAFAKIPAVDFSKTAAEVAKSLPGDSNLCNPVLAQSFTAKAPGSMSDVASRYAEILTEAGRKGAEAEKSGVKILDDPAWESLRAVLTSAESPLKLPDEGLVKFLDRAEQNALNVRKKAIDVLKTTHPGSPPKAMVVNDLPNPIEPRVLLRGNPGRPGKEVPRQFLKVLSGPDRKPFKNGSGRLELAQAIASKDNPLTARVLVNRVWLNHFGVGLVTTPSDFGTRSEPPSHPELLDWLADDFVRQGWSIKALHRRILLSNTYRQRSDNRPEALAKDPLNRLYWKFNRHRLDFEATRDALLAASGALDPSMGGRSVSINEPPYPPRRTVYGYIDRLDLDGIYRTFDFASPDASSPRRLITTVPQQALFLMNSPFVIDLARRLASRPEVASGTPEARVGRLYQRLFGRDPDPTELALGVAFIQRQEASGPSLPPPVWTYGFASLDSAASPAHRLDFHAFTHWTGTTWQFGPAMPHPETGFAQWNAAGGHTGGKAQHAVVLRWTAPRDLIVRVEGTIKHPNPNGDGVRALIVSGRDGILGDCVCHNQQLATTTSAVDLKRGETLDFMVACRGNDGFDSFTWAPIIHEEGPSGETWDASKGFHGPPTAGLSPWEEYAQVLMLTNEFVFVD